MKKLEEIELTTNGIRKALIDEINGIRMGTTTIERAKAICNLAKQVNRITKTEIELNAIGMGRNGQDTLLKPVKLCLPQK
jgi:hypothetical protein